MENSAVITRFYTAFSNSDAIEMISCYHDEAVFEDPAFGKLNRKEVAAMWKMLLERSKGNLKVEFKDVVSDGNLGAATWIATYIFSQTNRKVVNTIHAEFEFKEGLILKHKDNFDIYKWSKQALGWKGFLLGWTPFMQNGIQQNAKKALSNYMQKNA